MRRFNLRGRIRRCRGSSSTGESTRTGAASRQLEAYLPLRCARCSSIQAFQQDYARMSLIKATYSAECAALPQETLTILPGIVSVSTSDSSLKSNAELRKNHPTSRHFAQPAKKALRTSQR